MYLFFILVQHSIYLTSFCVQEKFDLPPNLGSLHTKPLLDLLFHLFRVSHISQHCGCDCGWVMTAMLYQHEVTNLRSKPR